MANQKPSVTLTPSGIEGISVAPTPNSKFGGKTLYFDRAYHGFKLGQDGEAHFTVPDFLAKLVLSRGRELQAILLSRAEKEALAAKKRVAELEQALAQAQARQHSTPASDDFPF